MQIAHQPSFKAWGAYQGTTSNKVYITSPRGDAASLEDFIGALNKTRWFVLNQDDNRDCFFRPMFFSQKEKPEDFSEKFMKIA